MNICVLVGRLTHDPELRYTQSGLPVCTFAIAVDRRKRDDGTNETDFIRVVTWRKIAETCSQYLSKGRLVAVHGRIQTGSYTARDGTTRKTFEVMANSVKFLGANGSNGSGKRASGAAPETSPTEDRSEFGNLGDEFGGEFGAGGGDIPF